MSESNPCRVCAQQSGFFARATILQQYDVRYDRCPSCGFIQTEKPYWLAEAYSDAIAISDTGLLRRNIIAAAITGSVIKSYFNPNGHFIDYGGGYGALTRLMRDQGLNFFRHDPMCENIFARGFDAKEQNSYELLTAFEVFEHLVDPRTEIENMLRLSRNILFTTLLVPEPPPAPNDWWYYGLNTGQHVALYARTSLAMLARQHGLQYVTDGVHWHLFTPLSISPAWFKLITRSRIARWRQSWLTGSGKMAADHAYTKNLSTPGTSSR